MSLEKEIHQAEFNNEYHKAIVNIFFTHNYIVDQMADVFKSFDITRQQYNVLRILRGQHPKHASVNLIKERMLDKMSDTSRIVERLRIKGLIKREDGKDDKRSVEITITEEGLNLLARMDAPVNNFEKQLHHLSIEETKKLNHLLDKIRQNTSAYTENKTPFEDLVSQHEKF